MKNKITIILLTFLSFNCQAEIYNVDGYKFNVNGFLGWKSVFTKDNQRFDNVSDFPEMGLIISSNFTKNLSGYFFGRYARTLKGAAVYSELRYSLPNIIDELHLSVRGGALINDYGLYNSTRVNPQTRLGVFLPSSIYPTTLRGEIASGIGVAFDGKYDNWAFSYAIMRKTVLNSESEAKAWSSQLKTVNNYFGDSQLAYLQYKSSDDLYRIKLSASKIDLGNDYENIPRNISEKLPHSGLESVILSTQYFPTHELELSAELSTIKQSHVKWSHFDNLIYSYSLTAKYDINENYTIFTNWNQFISPYKPTNDFDKIREKHQEFTIGGNWHKNNWQIGLDAHHISGGRFVDWNNFSNNPHDYSDFWVFAGNISYFFR